METRFIRVSLLALVLLALVLDGTDAQAGRRLRRVQITLDHPAVNAVIPQDDPATGCAYDPTRGYGFMIAFDWSTARPLPAGETFTLVLQHTGSAAPALQQEGLTNPSYDLVDCSSFVIDTNLSNWYWQVLVVDSKGQVRKTSAQQPLSFAPCRLIGGQVCNAP